MTSWRLIRTMRRRVMKEVPHDLVGRGGRKKKSGAGQRVREASVGSEDLDKDEAFTKKKLVVESDDDE